MAQNRYHTLLCRALMTGIGQAMLWLRLWQFYMSVAEIGDYIGVKPRYFIGNQG